MSRASTSALRDGVILNNRYRIVKQIGRGGFGRAYLAEDTQRYRELCVLKEFAPQVDRDEELRQAEDLFEREAGILYKLNHQQIPRFEALLRTRIDGKRSLFLVQEYVPGRSYWELLLRQDKLSESEVMAMLEDVLPILDYVHALELIHRDISPDNLILRDDNTTVLIDFGCVKVAANAVSRSRGHAATLIGKKGYSPDEQISRGRAMPCSDLYSLAATAVVLLTGKQPDRLFDHHSGQWDWNQIEASSQLKKILKKMLADRPCDRYQSAADVRQALTNAERSPINSFISRCRTLIVAPGSTSRHLDSSSFDTKNHLPKTPRQSRFKREVRYKARRLLESISTNFDRLRPWHWGLVASGILIVPGLISFTLIEYQITKTISLDFDRNSQDFVLSQTELDFQRQIHQRVQSLDLDASAFYKKVDAIFHQQHPELAGKTLSETSDHQEYRQEWYQIASSLLTRQERSR